MQKKLLNFNLVRFKLRLFDFFCILSVFPWVVSSWLNLIGFSYFASVSTLLILFILLALYQGGFYLIRIGIPKASISPLMVVFFILCVTAVPAHSGWKFGDRAWDSNNYHIPISLLIKQFDGLEGVPLIQGSTFYPSLMAHQFAFLNWLTGNLNSFVVITVIYILLIYSALYQYARTWDLNTKTSSIIAGSITLSSSTAIIMVRTGYSDIAHAFFWIIFISSLELSFRKNQLDISASIKLGAGVCGILSTKFSGYVPLFFVFTVWVVLLLTDKPKQLKGRSYYNLLTRALPSISLGGLIGLFWPVNAYLKTGQPLWPAAIPFFNAPAPSTLESINSFFRTALDPQTQSWPIIFIILWTWIGAIVDLLLLVPNLLTEGIGPLSRFVGFDPRPLGIGIMFHFIFIAALIYIAIAWKNQTLKHQYRTSIIFAISVVLVTWIPTGSSTFIRYFIGQGLFFVCFVVCIHLKEGFLSLRKRFLNGIVTLAIGSSLLVVSQTQIVNDIARNSAIVERLSFFFWEGDLNLSENNCPKIAVPIGLPQFSSILWQINSCSSITVNVSEADLVEFHEELDPKIIFAKKFQDRINGYTDRVKQTCLSKDTAFTRVSTVYGYPLYLIDPRRCPEILELSRTLARI